MSTLIPDQYRSTPSAPDTAHAQRSETPCRVYDPELWFAEQPDRVATAQTLCGACPLRLECLAGALERREPWGVWGGELFEHGAPVARKRGPGRPRKDDGQVRHAAEQALAMRLSDYAETVGASDLDLELDLLVACAPSEPGGAGASDGHVAA
jgi:WhiB family redox-sensing transcriptional regulator